MQNHVLDYLENIVDRVPDKIAFADEHQALSFRQLRELSRSVGSFLHREGICHEPVAVFMDRSAAEVAAFFGVITGGDFYVPIDAEMPESRIELIFQNVRPRIIICDEANARRAASLAGDGKAVLFDDICQTPVDEEALRVIHDSSIDTDPIYIVFTSGSTGLPKGVAACHRSVLDYVEQLSETLGFDSDTVFGSQTPLYFDACLKELYPTLKFGATTHLIPRDLFMFPVKLMEYLNEHRINTICWVASALTMVSAFGTFDTVKPQYLRTVAFGSEVFPVKQLKRWREAAAQAQFINLYGPTEGTGMCCFFKVDRDFAEGEVIPIGRPFKNTDIILLDENNHRAAPGEPGEICIRGTSLTLGYYNDFERSSQVFVQNPLNKAYSELIYRTGDLARTNERGELVFVSRKDHQIKRMGHRIELGEIEADTALIDGVALAGCVHDRETGRIALYYTGSIDEKALAAQLREKLPRYMLPNRVQRLEQMPFTANGKLDRTTLLRMYQKR